MKTNNVAITTAAQSNASDMIGDTGWSHSYAASMAKECAREHRLFGQKSRTRRTQLTPTQRANRFLEQTGWTLEAAASMAKECMRDRRLFGGPAMYAQV
jgi:hypothetical protein